MQLSNKLQDFLNMSVLNIEHQLLRKEYYKSPEYDNSQVEHFLKINDEIPIGNHRIRAYNAKMKEFIRNRHRGGLVLDSIQNESKVIRRQQRDLQMRLDEVEATWDKLKFDL